MKPALFSLHRPALVLSLAALMASFSLSAAAPAQSRTQAETSQSAMPRELAPLDLMLFVHRADLGPALRPVDAVGRRHGDGQ